MHPEHTAAPSDQELEDTDQADFADQTADPIFQQEQQHLTQTYTTLKAMGSAVQRQMEKAREEAA
ncbi:MAG: hypothetical protein RR505_14395, partial [Raoultibacter sp.]